MILDHPATAAPSVPGLFPAVAKLLRLRLTILISGIRRASLRGKIGWGILAVLVIGFAGLMLFLSWGLLKLLDSPQVAQFLGDVQPLVDSIPAAVMAVVFISTLLTSFGVLLQALYLAGDMDFLLSAPIPMRAVFLSKLLQAVLPNFGLFCLFTLPVLWGLGVAYRYSLLYFFLAPLLLAALALAAAGISSLLVMAIVRIFPARRVAEVIGFIGATFTFLCSQSGNLMRFSEFDESQAMRALETWERINQPWSPISWAGEGLVAIGRLDWLPGLGFTALTLLGCGLVFAVALPLAERLYFTGWASLQGTPRKKKNARAGQKTAAIPSDTPAARLLPQAVRALIAKDLLVFRRDVSQMSQLVTPLIFGLVYVFIFFRGMPGREEFSSSNMPALASAALGNMGLYANVGFSLFVSWMLLSRLAGAGFSQEGRQFWILKQSPLRPKDLMLAKFLVAYLPSVLLSWLFLFGISIIQKAGLQAVLYSLLVLALTIGGSAGLNLGLGAVAANFEWDDPRQMMKMKGGTGCLVLILNLAHIPLSLLLFFGPPLLATFLQLPEIAGQFAGFILGIALNLAWAAIPLRFALKRFPTLGEN